MEKTILPTYDVKANLRAAHRQTAEGCIKIEEDLHRYEIIIGSSRPDVIIECGTHVGRSATWFTKHDVDVVTVDTLDVVEPELRDNPRVRWLRGSSTDTYVVDHVRTLVEGRRTMVVLDSDHSAAHVKQEIEYYAQFVTPDCYLVIEDGILRWLPAWYKGNPLDAIEETIVHWDGWERDTVLESMYDSVTMYPAGWWKRVK